MTELRDIGTGLEIALVIGTVFALVAPWVIKYLNRYYDWVLDKD